MPGEVSIEAQQPSSRTSLYRPGDAVHLNCTAKAARPKANLVWLINGMAVKAEKVVLESVYS